MDLYFRLNQVFMMKEGLINNHYHRKIMNNSETHQIKQFKTQRKPVFREISDSGVLALASRRAARRSTATSISSVFANLYYREKFYDSNSLISPNVNFSPFLRQLTISFLELLFYLLRSQSQQIFYHLHKLQCITVDQNNEGIQQHCRPHRGSENFPNRRNSTRCKVKSLF